MKLSPLFLKIWSFETIHCLNFNTQRQKRYDVTNDVKVKLLISGFAGCMKNMLFLAKILFFVIFSMCAIKIRRKVDTDSFLPKVCMI